MTTSVDFEIMLELNSVEEVNVNDKNRTLEIYFNRNEDSNIDNGIPIILNNKLKWVREWYSSFIISDI